MSQLLSSHVAWKPALLMLAMFTTPALALELTIAAGSKDRPAGPVCSKPGGSVDPKQTYVLVGRGGDAIAAQADDQGRIWWWMPPMKAGESAMYRLEPRPASVGSGVKVEQVKDGLIQVTIDGQPFTAFNYGPDLPKPYLYPVIGPTGDPVARDYPMKDNPLEKQGKPSRQDHRHHRSLWTAHGDVRTHDFDKSGSNYWDDAPQKGTASERVRKILRLVSGPVFGQIEAEVDWVNKQGQREIREDRTYTFFGADGRERIIDARIAFHFDDMDVMFADTKEGGIIAMRLAVTMDEVGAAGAHGQMCNSNGQVGEKQCWGKPADWCDYVGPVNGKGPQPRSTAAGDPQTVGVAIMDAPANFRHPTTWHIRGYGLYTANPFGLAEFTGDKSKDGSKLWKKGESVEFNYRIVIHAGDTKAARIANQYTLYAEPPTVTSE